MECSSATNMLKSQTFLPAAVVIMRSNLVLGAINSNMLWKRLPFVLTEHRIRQIHLDQQNLLFKYSCKPTSVKRMELKI